MALSGTLKDLGIVDLIRFPVSAHKTGELIITTPSANARLYYSHGELRHVVCGDAKGMAAMVELVDWSDGSFEFRQDVTSDVVTVDVSVERLISNAIEASNARKASQHSLESPVASILQSAMEEAASNLEYMRQAALFTMSGVLICNWQRESDHTDVGVLQLLDEVKTLAGGHPRDGLSKIFLVDTQGTCIASFISNTFILLLNADDLASMGMVSLASTKLTAALLNTFK
ncbi:MAG: DUF4388 domain-containing protein [Deltaproteobacteria bacterium]|nr:DUF4388 domain-containing protein [Deltaproteobacteria bacterium]